MGYVRDFEHDVYICFADADNAVLTGSRTKKGWVDQLAECLEGLLRAQGIPRPALCTSLEGNLPITARLDHMTAAATVVVVLSPAFLESEWCTDPTLAAGVRERAARRPDCVFVVEKSETDRSREPFFDQFRNDEFWVRQPGTSRPLGIPDLQSSGDSQAYYAVALGFAAALSRVLRELAQPGAAATTAAARIFLAEATDDVRNQRADVQRTLEQAGFEIVPRGRLPVAPELLQSELRRVLPDCRAFVQLLGDGARQDLARVTMQLDVALGVGVPVLQWRDDRLDVARVDRHYRQLLLRETVRAETISDFCHAIVALASRPPDVSADRPTVFVDTHPQQIDDVERIFRRYQRVQWDWHQPTLKGLKTVIKAVDGVIIYWGSGDSNRTQERYYIFQNQFKALRKSLDRLLIYDGPPPDKPEFRGAGFRVANGRNGDEPEALRNFLSEIARAG